MCAWCGFAVSTPSLAPLSRARVSLQILKLEKECGIKRQTTLEHVAEKLEPVKHAVVTAGTVVVKKAHELKSAASEKLHRPSESTVVVHTPSAGARRH